MKKNLIKFVICILFATVQTKKPEMPLCPANIPYFPQNLPMHCRMATNANYNNYPTMPPFPSDFFSLPPGKFPESLPGLPGPIPPPMSMPMPIPLPMPMQMPMPMPPMAPPAHKLPVVVMPLYSPDKSFQKKKEKRRKRPHHITEDSADIDTSADDSSDTSSEDQAWWRRSNTIKKPHRHRHHPRHNTRRQNYQRKELITPVLQYVTKDGYVIYEKQISKGEASDWIHMQRGDDSHKEVVLRDNDNHKEVMPHVEEPDQDFEMIEETRNKNVVRMEKPKTGLEINKGPRKHQKKQLKITSAN